jgi:hypothetical protein
MSDLDTLSPAPTVVRAAGRDVEIRPLRFGQLAKAGGLLSKILGAAALGYAQAGAEAPSPEAIAEAVLAGGEDAYALLELGTGVARAEMDEMSAEEGLELAAAFLEVNSDFFVRQVLPRLKAALAKAQAGAGRT